MSETTRSSDQAVTLTIDIGGTGIKMITVDHQGKPTSERLRELTPDPATPDALLALIGAMLEVQPAFDRVSVGFPGVVVRGVTRTAPNLGSERWRELDLQSAIAELSGKPTRVMNDADLQGYGVIEGRGLELVLTLGTGLGSGLYVDGRLAPNLELAHHPFEKDQTYEQRIGDAALDRAGKKRWRERVARMFRLLDRVFNVDLLHIGGGNARKLRAEDLPASVRVFDNVEGMTGGLGLWQVEQPGSAGS